MSVPGGRTSERDHAAVPKILLGFVAVLGLVLLWTSLRANFDHDEFEHIHSAWLVMEGHAPYRDFYQNHHPLLWYFLTPILSLWGPSSAVLLPARLFMFVLAVVVVVLTYKIAWVSTRSRETALLSMLLLLSMTLFLEKCTEIRPDVPQVLLALLSVYSYLQFVASEKLRPLVLSGLYWSASFLFLQKSLFLLVAYAFLTLLFLVRKDLSWKGVTLFAASLLAPFVLFLLFILIQGSLKDYLWTNWIVNVVHLNRFSPIGVFGRTTQNWVFLFLAAGGCLLAFRPKAVCPELRSVAFMGCVTLGCLFLIPHPFPQYFLLPVSLLCVPAGYFLATVLGKLKVAPAWKAVMVGVLAAWVPLTVSLKTLPRKHEIQKAQIQRIDYVLRHTTEDDYVYDGDIQFNLFRKDLHYFWYSVGPCKGLDSFRKKIQTHALFQKLAGEECGNYDIHRLIESKMPKIISDFMLEKETSDFLKNYQPVPIENFRLKRNIYIRTDDGARGES